MRNLIKLILLFFNCLVFSQTITGKIENLSKEKINSANIIIRNADKPDEISEFVIAKNGGYTINLSKTYSKIIVEVSAFGHNTTSKIIENPKKGETYSVSFTLAKEETKEIKEVVITSKRKAFTVKEDTVTYNVSAYRDGTETKIEDIIKKLPGIEINEKSGEIKYKGKSIETVQLEGDDLFGSNYSLGTRNINVDLVEQVQALENYSANPLLKGIENGDKVALNLKLKKGKIGFSGNIDFGSGFSEYKKQVYNLNSNVLAVSKKFKSFSTISYNNVGVNDTPFDYFGFNQNVEEIEEGNFIAKKIIPETLYTSVLDEERVNLNNLLFGNYNSIFKISKKASLKTNLYYTNDKISLNQSIQNSIIVNNTPFYTSDYYNTQKKPVLYRGDLELKINTSTTSLLEYKFKISQENVNTLSSVVQNNALSYNTKLLSESFFLNQNLLFTKKLNSKNALQILLFQGKNNTPQNYSAAPHIKIDSVTNFTTQYSKFQKNIFGIKSTLLGAFKKDRYIFSLGADYTKTPYNSEMLGLNNISLNLLENNVNYIKNNIYFAGAYHFTINNFKISPSFNLALLEQKIENPNLSKNNLIFEPEFTIKYKINEVSIIASSVNYSQKPFSENFYFQNTVFTDVRNSIKNMPSLELQKSTLYKISYTINNLYKQFQLNTGISYSKNNSNYFPNIKISEYATSTEYFFLSRPNDNFNTYFTIEKYIPLLESTFRITTNFSQSKYQNIINNSELRINKNQYYQNSFFFKTAFDFKINFENTIKLGQNISQTDTENKIRNNTFYNNFKIIIKPSKKYFFLLSSDYYIPDTSRKQNYHFLDATWRYDPNKIINFSFYAKNILNKKYFSQIETSDYSTAIFLNNIIPRYYMFNITYNF